MSAKIHLIGWNDHLRHGNLVIECRQGKLYLALFEGTA